VQADQLRQSGVDGALLRGGRAKDGCVVMAISVKRRVRPSRCCWRPTAEPISRSRRGLPGRLVAIPAVGRVLDVALVDQEVVPRLISTCATSFFGSTRCYQ
jgi:hypothetical protein